MVATVAAQVAIVAELGQNHQGSVDMAKSMIDLCAFPVLDEWNARELRGVDYVKLQKRDLQRETTRDYADMPYTGPHSFGTTYGTHRAALELDYDQHHELYRYARERGLGLIETACAPSAVDGLVERFMPARWKVASRDLTNHPLIDRMAETGTGIILSTGMADESDLNAALDVVDGRVPVVVMHCLSMYPADYRKLNLRTISYLKGRNLEVGFSDHSIGLMAGPVAVALGATWLEKHVTLSHRLPGSDHAGSLEGTGLWRYVRDVRNCEDALGRTEMYRDPACEPARQKLERSICSGDWWIRVGETVTESNTALLSPGTGVRWPDRHRVFGRKARCNIPPRTVIELADLTD